MFNCWEPEEPRTDFHRQVTLVRAGENGAQIRTTCWVLEDLAVEGKRVRMWSHNTYEGEWPDKRKVEHYHPEIWTVESVSDMRQTPDQFQHHIPTRPRKRRRGPRR